MFTYWYSILIYYSVLYEVLTKFNIIVEYELHVEYKFWKRNLFIKINYTFFTPTRIIEYFCKSYTERTVLLKYLKNLARYKFENNFVEPSK